MVVLDLGLTKGKSETLWVKAEDVVVVSEYLCFPVCLQRMTKPK